MREFNGVVNHEGQRFGTLEIGAVVQRYPAPRYRTVCSRCGAQSVIGQDKLRTGTARCVSAGCGAPAAPQTAKEFLKSEREREAALKAEREAREQTAVAEAERELTETHRRLHEELKSQVVKGPDHGLTRDALADNLILTEQEASVYNKQQLEIFRQQHPEAFLSAANIDQLADYFERNGIHKVSANTISAAYARLLSFGLLELRSAVADPVVIPTPSRVLEPGPTSDPVPDTATAKKTATVGLTAVPLVQGFDVVTGRPRDYTTRELNRLSAADYRLALGIERGYPRSIPD